MDKTIEVVKSAMEKEQKAKQASKSMDEKIDNNNETDDTKKSKAPPQEDSDMNTGKQNDEILDELNDAAEEISLSEDEVTDKDKTDEKPSKSAKSFLKGAKSKELEAKEQKIQELTDRLMRTMAEFDNYRKRTEKEKAQMFDLGVKSIVEKILPVIDNFERGISSINEADKESPLAQGYNMIYKQLITIMDEIGVKPIEAVGKEFDPNFHNAVMHGEDENLGENIVAEEFQKGYMYNDVVIRHSMVKVVN